MTTKQYLGQIERLDKMIQNKLSEVYQLKTLSTNITVATDNEKVQTSGCKDRLGDIISKIVDLENESGNLINELIVKRESIITQIESLSNSNHYQVLFAKYIEYKTIDDVADKMKYSRRQIIRIHRSALNAFERKYGEEYLSLNVTTEQ